MRSAKLCAMLLFVFTLSPTSVHADVDDQGTVSALQFGATASQPAYRLDPPQPVPEVTVPRTVEQMIRDVWPDNLEERALRIAYRESRYQPRVHTFCCYGIFQIYLKMHQGWLADMGIYTIEDLYDPLNNIKAAYQLYLLDGWGPWQT